MKPTPPTLGVGLGLKPEHYGAAVAATDPGLWFEVHPENYLFDGGPRLRWLSAVRDAHPLSLHGVSLSLAGESPPDEMQLVQLARFAARFEPALVSEHLAWSRHDGHYLPDLLPFVRSNTSLTRICAHVDRVQEVLQRSIAIENPSHYLRIDDHSWDEIDFLSELSSRTGCSLLLDLNNLHVSAANLGFDALDWLQRFPLHRVSEVHLAGHSIDSGPGEALLIDSHDAPVAPPVWALYQVVIDRRGRCPTLIERDADLPAFDVLMAERRQAVLMQAAR